MDVCELSSIWLNRFHQSLSRTPFHFATCSSPPPAAGTSNALYMHCFQCDVEVGYLRLATEELHICFHTCQIRNKTVRHNTVVLLIGWNLQIIIIRCSSQWYHILLLHVYSKLFLFDFGQIMLLLIKGFLYRVSPLVKKSGHGGWE